MITSALYGTDHGRLVLAAPFLLDWLREGSVCFLTGPAASRNDILEHLHREGTQKQSDIEAGRLIVSHFQKTPRAQYDYYQKHITTHERAGTRSFRLFGDAIGARDTMTPEGFADAEEGLDRIVLSHPVIMMCAYDVRKFTGIELLTALKGHRDGFWPTAENS